jgi:hypothetical protein
MSPMHSKIYITAQYTIQYNLHYSTLHGQEMRVHGTIPRRYYLYYHTGMGASHPLAVAPS